MNASETNIKIVTRLVKVTFSASMTISAAMAFLVFAIAIGPRSYIDYVIQATLFGFIAFGGFRTLQVMKQVDDILDSLSGDKPE